MQAGSSEAGREFAARWAEVIFSQLNDESVARSFYGDMKARVDRRGRDPRSCAVMPALEVFVGETESEAQDQADYIDSLIRPEVGVENLGKNVFGRDLSSFSMDTPLSQIELPPGGSPVEGMYQNLLGIRRGGRELTLGEASVVQTAESASFRMVGTPESVVDEMQHLYETDCCDGFVITPAPSPAGAERFVEHIVPELQKRGLYRTAYTANTFRGHLQDQLA